MPALVRKCVARSDSPFSVTTTSGLKDAIVPHTPAIQSSSAFSSAALIAHIERLGIVPTQQCSVKQLPHAPAIQSSSTLSSAALRMAEVVEKPAQRKSIKARHSAFVVHQSGFCQYVSSKPPCATGIGNTELTVEFPQDSAANTPSPIAEFLHESPFLKSSALVLFSPSCPPSLMRIFACPHQRFQLIASIWKEMRTTPPC